MDLLRVAIIITAMIGTAFSYTIGLSDPILPTSRQFTDNSFIRFVPNVGSFVIDCTVDGAVLDKDTFTCKFNNSNVGVNFDQYTSEDCYTLHSREPVLGNCRYYMECREAGASFHSCHYNLLFDALHQTCVDYHKSRCCEYIEKNPTVILSQNVKIQ